MIKKIFIFACVAALAAVNVQAEEDGEGTNVVRNLRVIDGGTMELGGVPITNWASVPATDATARDTANWASNAIAPLQDATNSLNASIVNFNNATNALNTATSSLNSAVGLLQTEIFAGAGTTGRITSAAGQEANFLKGDGTWGAPAGGGDFMANGSVPMTGNLNGGGNSATNFANIDALAAATNALNTATGALNTAVSGKLDQIGGSATNLTVTNLTSKGNTIYMPAGEQTVGAEVRIDPTGLTYVKIKGASDANTITDPQIGGTGEAGQVLIIQGNDNNLRVKLISSGNLVLSTGVPFTMGSNDIMQLVYNGEAWVETHRADK